MKQSQIMRQRLMDVAECVWFLAGSLSHKARDPEVQNWAYDVGKEAAAVAHMLDRAKPGPHPTPMHCARHLRNAIKRNVPVCLLKCSGNLEELINRIQGGNSEVQVF